MPTMSTEEMKRMEKFHRLHPPQFGSDASEDAHDFLDRCHQVLQNMGLVESNLVDFTTLQPRGASRI